ncbi:hypothetical protein NN561_020268 [Cricetulus griseus]
MELENIVANTVLLKAREGKLGWSGACMAHSPRAGLRVPRVQRACKDACGELVRAVQLGGLSANVRGRGGSCFCP